MKKNVILSGVMGAVLLFGTLVCHAEKWDKNKYVDKTVESAYYDADSIKVQGKTVSWTEKSVLTSGGATFVTGDIKKYEACKQNIEKKGNVTQYQVDYQIEKGKYRGVALRYYNKANEIVCTDKDMGNEFNTSWNKIVRGSPIQQSHYDLVTKYKVNLQ